MQESVSTRRVMRVRHEVRMRELHVRHVRPLGASFARVTLGGDALADFTSLSFDDHVKLLLPAADGGVARRDYTPRGFDAARRELVIDFVLHAHGPASDWARGARAGDALRVAGPRGSMIVALEQAWHLLVGDAAALPAIERRLEELPAGARAIALVQVPRPDDVRALRTRADARVEWVHDAQALLGALHAVRLPTGEGFAWCAGEASLMKRCRDLLAGDKGLSKEAMKVSAYWKHGATEFHEHLE